MRDPLLIAWALAVGVAGPARAQVLALTEYDVDRGRHAADGRHTPVIVDVNSVIGIVVDKDSLRHHAARLSGTAQELDSLIARATLFQRAAAEGLAALPGLRAALESLAANPLDRPRQQAFQEASRRIIGPLGTINAGSAPESPLRAQINAVLDRGARRSMVFQVQSVFEVVALYAERLRESVDARLREDGVALLVGAWISTGGVGRPVHLPGFDEYPEGPYVVVDRWSLALTAEQQSRLQTLKDDAEDLRANGVDIAAELRAGIREAIQTVADSALACADRMHLALEAARAAAVGPTRDDLAGAIVALDRAKAAVGAIGAAYGPAGSEARRDPVGFVLGAGANLDALLEALRSLRATLEDVGGSTAAGRSSLVAALNSCRLMVDSSASVLENYVGPVAHLLTDIRRIDTATLEFGEDVLRLDIASAPDATRLDLKWTGPRTEGDVVVVRVGLARRDERPTSIEEHQLVMYRVLPHLRLAVDLIFADPVPDDLSESLPTRFQPGASTSVLYTWGSRRSTGYNRFWRLGVGANFAALDLNRDGTQELGIGLALSAFAEVVQAGLGYDMGQDATYWFFALQLPFFRKALAVPGGSSGEAPPP